MDFQEALETAFVNMIVAEGITVVQGSLPVVSINARNCKRMYDGRPDPTAGNFFVSVWSRNFKRARDRNAIDETFRCFATVTRRFDQRPFDRWVTYRDEVDKLLSQVIAVGMRDSWSWTISNEMNRIAGFTWQPGDTTKRIGAAEALYFEEASDIVDVGPDWFNAGADSQSGAMPGCQATARFIMRRVQNILTAR